MDAEVPQGANIERQGTLEKVYSYAGRKSMTDWSKKLYAFGYLLTNEEKRAIQHLHWLSEWKNQRIRDYTLFVHPQQKYCCHETERYSLLLVGHAYNPFSMEADEQDILAHLASLEYDSDEYRDYFDQLTGVFFYAVVRGNTITATCDCAGMLGANYAIIHDGKCFSAHSQMIADIYDLEEDPYVTRMKKSKLFHWYGWFLPGDLTSYSEVRRIVPNTEVTLGNKAIINRFYPRKSYTVAQGKEYDVQVEQICTIMNNNLKLIADKWTNPAISLTGGTDSKTTLACARGIQDRFSYFSYISLPREETDALAAQKICQALHLKHTIYKISTAPNQMSDYAEVSNLIERHYAYLGKANTNDICKRIVLSTEFDYDVEVKSWVSEVARASRYEKYGRKSFPKKMRPRMLTSMYKVFCFDRSNAIKTDRRFKDYLDGTGLARAIEETGYPWTEFFVWEIVFGGWGGLTLTGEHMLSNDITVPFNNRTMLDMMLRTPLTKRMHDHLHKDMMNLMDERIEQLGIHVINGNETRLRALLEGTYFCINNILPF